MNELTASLTKLKNDLYSGATGTIVILGLECKNKFDLTTELDE